MTIPENKAIGYKPNSPNAPPKRGKNYLFLVGIDAYQHHQKLTNAVNDARSIKKVLTQQYGFDVSDVFELYDEKATSDAIKRQLLRYKSLNTDDNLLFFYSGHGFYLDDLGYLVPVDGEDEANFILNSTIRDFLKPIKAKHIALIFDSCFSGSFVLNRDASVGSRLSEKASRWALAAGNIELVSDGIAGRNAPFTGALLDVLNNSKETELGIQELFVEARNLTISRGAKQTPIGGQMAMDGNDGGEFVFYRTNNEANAWNALDTSDKNALNAFISKYPQSLFLSEARAFITEIEAKEAEKRKIGEDNRKTEAEKQAFERTKKSGTKESLSHFIFDYPLSIYRPEARKLLEIAEEATSWKEAKRKNTLSAFMDFQDIYGTGQFGDDCQKRIDSFRKPTAPVYVPPPVETPQPPVVVTAPKVETFAPTAEKSKEKMAQVVDNQKHKKVFEPSFFEKYKVLLFACGLVLMAFLKWYVGINRDVDKTTPSVSTPFVEPQMVQVQGGTFKMGSNENDDEKPIHKVVVADFYIGKYEVTQAEWESVMGNNPSSFKGGSLPVENVSWNDIQKFLTKINAKTNKKYLLPTEVEWEFAARGGSASKEGYTYSGSNDVKSVAWMDENAERKTHSVGQKSANELGIYDMSGNVWEWCQDWYKGYPGSSGVSDYTGSSHVGRGGSWLSYVGRCRSAIRFNGTPAYHSNDLGFRLALSSLQ